MEDSMTTSVEARKEHEKRPSQTPIRRQLRPISYCKQAEINITLGLQHDSYGPQIDGRGRAHAAIRRTQKAGHAKNLYSY